MLEDTTDTTATSFMLFDDRIIVLNVIIDYTARSLLTALTNPPIDPDNTFNSWLNFY